MTHPLRQLRSLIREWRMGRAALTLLKLADRTKPHDMKLACERCGGTGNVADAAEKPEYNVATKEMLDKLADFVANAPPLYVDSQIVKLEVGAGMYTVRVTKQPLSIMAVNDQTDDEPSRITLL